MTKQTTQPIFIAQSLKAGTEEIDDLYWFEENGVHYLDGQGLNDSFEIKSTVETIVSLMRRMTEEERMEVIEEFCRYCGDLNPKCQCWNDE